MSKTTLPPHQDKGIKTSVVFHKTLLSVAIASAFMLNFPISHAESLIEEEISSSQKFNDGSFKFLGKLFHLDPFDALF